MRLCFVVNYRLIYCAVTALKPFSCSVDTIMRDPSGLMLRRGVVFMSGPPYLGFPFMSRTVGSV